MKIDLTFIHSITPMSAAPITRYLNKMTVLICNKLQKSFVSVKDF